MDVDDPTPEPGEGSATAEDEPGVEDRASLGTVIGEVPIDSSGSTRAMNRGAHALSAPAITAAWEVTRGTRPVGWQACVLKLEDSTEAWLMATM